VNGTRRELRLATRASRLALAQSRQVADQLERASGRRVALVQVSSASETVGGDKSRFVRGVERALLDGIADLAVHSAKDVPGERPESITLAAVTARADARDVLCGVSGLDDLPPGARVGTSSLRRRAQLLALRPDLHVTALHGNVDTRLLRLDHGEFDAIVLAAAGLERLGHARGARLAPEQMLPAPGQGALVLECRAGDEEALELASNLNDPDTERTLQAERALATALGATCHTPLAAYAELRGERLTLEAFVGDGDGTIHARVVAFDDARHAQRLAQTVVRKLQEEHGRALGAALYADAGGGS
jgi:hydroxymethylbilane synthase